MSKTVLVMGGSRGIGKATVMYFAKRGYKVAFTYNKSLEEAKALKESLSDFGYETICLPCDVSKPIEVESAIKQAVYSFGKIDVLVNNAGIAQQKIITDITDDDWDKMLGVNLSGTFYACRAVTPFMVSEKFGSIVNVSSMWGEVGASCEVHYSAAKAGVIGLTKALAKELGPSNIRVNCVTPGVIDTEMNMNLDLDTMQGLADETPLSRVGTAEEVAAAIFYLANGAEFVTGQILGVNGGIVI